MSGDLIAFLNARLDEDEAYGPRPLEPGEYPNVFEGHEPGAPKRVLREVAAKRAILAWWQRGDPDPEGPAPSLTYENYRRSLPGYQLLLHLAAVYSDHPDYREEWKP